MKPSGGPPGRDSTPTYSVSGLMAYEACPYQYYLTYVRRVPPPLSPAMALGTNIHALIAAHFTQPSLLEPEATPEALELFNRFLQSRLNTRAILFEQAFTLPFAGGSVRGRIDAVFPLDDGRLELVDFKSGRPEAREWLGDTLQLPLYGMAVAERFGCSPEELLYTYHFLRDGSEQTTAPTPDSKQQITQRVDTILHAIQRGQFIARPGCQCYVKSRGPCCDTSPQSLILAG